MNDLPALLAAASSEQLRRMRLEEIFMPEGRRLRNERYSSSTPPRFVHYTRAEAALGIIETKRLWLRNATSMVDYREVHHGYNLLSQWFNIENNRDRFVHVFDEIHPGAAMDALTAFDQMWNRSDIGIPTQTYIGSVSVHDPLEDEHGRLSMWRAFGANAPARVALVFRVPPLSEAVQFLQCIFSPVAYLNQTRAHALFKEVVDNAVRERDFLKTLSYLELRNSIFTSFVMAATCFKHEGFREEQEWRIIYIPGFYPKPEPCLIESEIIPVGGVPQIVYKFPIDGSVAPEIAAIDLASIFDRLILGPSQYPWVQYDAFKRSLEKAGVTDPSVIASTIPIRS